MAGGRGCQEQQQQQEGIKGAWDGAAANGGKAERGEGRGARESWLQRKKKGGGNSSSTFETHKAQKAETDGRRSLHDILQGVWI